MPKTAPFEAYHHRYDTWFERHTAVYYSELLAVRALPWRGRGLSMGVGTGRFAAPLGVEVGIDPAEEMLAYAAKRGISVVRGVAEALPFPDQSFDYALSVTTLCFVDDVAAMLNGAYRILRPGGELVLGFVDRKSALGGHYKAQRSESVFYQQVNHKRLRRLLSTYELGLPRSLPKHTPSPVRRLLKGAAGSLNLIQDVAPGPFDVLATDFTEVVYDGGRHKAQLMAVLDLESRYVVGWAVGRSANRDLALRCWDEVRSNLAEFGCSLEGRIIHHDQDSVYTSYQWLRAVLIEDGMRVSYAERRAKDNPHVESMWGRLNRDWFADQ